MVRFNTVVLFYLISFQTVNFINLHLVQWFQRKDEFDCPQSAVNYCQRNFMNRL